MMNGTALYQTLLGCCEGSPDGMATLESPAAQAAATELFHWLYKKAFYYFCSRHPESDAEEYAARCTQRVWEKLLEVKTLRGIRNADAFLGVAVTAIRRECWRCQTGVESDASHSADMDESDGEEDGENWLDWVSANQPPTPEALTLKPETFVAQLRECLLGALGRIKGLRSRAVVILKYLLHLEDAALAARLEISAEELRRLRVRAAGHGLDPDALSEALDLPVPQVCACLDGLRAVPLPDEAVAQVVGMAIETLNSLRARAKERGLTVSSPGLLAERFSGDGAASGARRLAPDGLWDQAPQVALAFDQALKEYQRAHDRASAGLAEDYEIALVLGTTRNNVQAILSRVKAQLREDREFLACIAPE